MVAATDKSRDDPPGTEMLRFGTGSGADVVQLDVAGDGSALVVSAELILLWTGEAEFGSPCLPGISGLTQVAGDGRLWMLVPGYHSEWPHPLRSSRRFPALVNPARLVWVRPGATSLAPAAGPGGRTWLRIDGTARALLHTLVCPGGAGCAVWPAWPAGPAVAVHIPAAAAAAGCRGGAAGFGTWLRGQVMAGLADAAALIIALDGKTVRGARTKDGTAPHLLVAMICGARAVIAQRDVDVKTNEITQVKPLLEEVDITGALVTADALCGHPHNASYEDPVVMPTGVGACRRSAGRRFARPA